MTSLENEGKQKTLNKDETRTARKSFETQILWRKKKGSKLYAQKDKSEQHFGPREKATPLRKQQETQSCISKEVH